MAQNPIVTFVMENGSSFKAELYPEVAPRTTLTTQIGLEPTTSAVTGRRSNQLSH